MADPTAFLCRAAAEPFAYGEWDCAMTLANWVKEQSGVDPAPDLRGAYATEEGWLEIVADEGSLLMLVERLALAARLHEVSDYQRGDIAVVTIPGLGEAGAIRGEGRWVMKLAGRMVGASDQRVAAAWGFR